MFKKYALILVTIFTLSNSKGQESVNLIENNTTEFTIIYPSNPSLTELNATKQLAKHLNKTSKATFKTAREGSGVYTKVISVGDTKLFKNHLGKVKAILGEDGIIINANGDHLFLNGEGARGVLYAVYQFLEDHVKISFWSPEVYEYPNYKNLRLNSIALSYTPPFFYRSHYSYNANFSAEFATILKENGDFQPLNKGWGSQHKLLGWVHTFSQVLPPLKYFAIHPEWFADPENNYMPSNSKSNIPDAQATQLCLSNKALQQEFLKNLLLWIKQNPSYDLVSVSQNDNKGFCNCSACKKIIQQEGATSGLLLRFVNLMATEVGKRYPNKTIETLAYYATEQAPKLTKPDKNVMIRFAPLEADMAKPIESVNNQSVRSNIDQWANISENNFFWGYNTNFRHALLPYPSLRKTLTDIDCLKTNNFKGVFIQDNTNPEGYGYFLDMQAWVIAKTLWNPGQDSGLLIKRFFNGYYGEAGKPLYRYFKLVENSFTKSRLKLLAYHSDYSFFTDSDIKQANALFTEALAKTAGNKTLFERIKKEQLSYDFMLTYIGKKNSTEKGEFLSAFINKVHQNINVDYALKKYNHGLIEEIEDAASKRDIKITTKETKIEQGKFILYKKGFVTNIVYDSAATDKLAATISGESKDWSIQVNLGKSNIISQTRFKVKSSLRVDTKINIPSSNSTIVFGIYDPQSDKEIIKKEIPLEKVKGLRYIEVELGDVLLNKPYIIWFSVNSIGNEVDHLFVDNITLLKK